MPLTIHQHEQREIAYKATIETLNMQIDAYAKASYEKDLRIAELEQKTAHNLFNQMVLKDKRIDELEAQVTKLTSDVDIALEQEAHALRAEAEAVSQLNKALSQLAEVRTDATRYRYIRDTATLDTVIWEALEGFGSDTPEGYCKGLDDAVDRAIAAQVPGGGNG